MEDILKKAQYEIDIFERPSLNVSLALIDEVKSLRAALENAMPIPKQEPAVAVHDDGLTDSTDHVQSIINKSRQPSPRITEQDAGEIIASWFSCEAYDVKKWIDWSVWVDTKGRALLNKLNANAVAAQAAAIPEGWQLVPVRPTGEMIDAMREEVIGAEDYVMSYFNAYHAALSASPKPE